MIKKQATQFTAVIFTLIFCHNYKVKAQALPSRNEVKISSLVNYYVYKYYKPDSTAMENCCEKGFLFVKFNVDSTGHITALSYTDNSPEFIQKALASALKHIEFDIFLITEMKNQGLLFYYLWFMIIMVAVNTIRLLLVKNII